MANVVAMYLSDNAAISDELVEILEQNYAIPLCWLACYAQDDLVCMPDTDGIEHQLLVTPRKTAQTRFTERRASLIRRFSSIANYIEQWEAMLAIPKQHYLITDISEVIGLHEDGQRIVQHALSFFHAPTQVAFQSLLQVTALCEVYDAGNQRLLDIPELQYFTIGSKVADWIPWEESDDYDDFGDVTEAPDDSYTSPQAPVKRWWEFWK